MEKSYPIGRAMGTSGTALPNGGTTGQVLAKKSNADQDVEWKSIEIEVTKEQVATALGISTAQLEQLSSLAKLLTVNDKVSISADVVAKSYDTTN